MALSLLTPSTALARWHTAVSAAVAIAVGAIESKLSADRARAWCLILGMALLVAISGWVLTSHGGIDVTGKPIGTDFTSFYAASTLALGGHADQVYEQAAHRAAQQQIFARDIPYAAFFYPPMFLLICWPLALLPYLWSLAIWQGTTFLLYWRTLRAVSPPQLGALPLLAFPAVALTLGHGQNAFLSTALFAAAVASLNRHAAMAGVLFGALVYKPQLGLVIPFALLAMRRWTTLATAAATVAMFAAASYLAFGEAAWRGFVAGSAAATDALNHNLVGDYKMQSTFAAVRLLGGSVATAYAVHAAVALLVLVAMMMTLRKDPEPAAAGALMVAATLLVSPFVLDYDLLLLALPLVWLFSQAMQTGFRPGEKLICALAFVLPLIARTIALATNVPLGTVVIFAVFALVALRMANKTKLGPRDTSKVTTAHRSRAP